MLLVSLTERLLGRASHRDSPKGSASNWTNEELCEWTLRRSCREFGNYIRKSQAPALSL